MSTGHTFPAGVGAPILLEGLQVIGRVRPPSVIHRSQALLGAAPSARLIDDLIRIKELRRQRTAEPIFSPERAARQGNGGLIRQRISADQNPLFGVRWAERYDDPQEPATGHGSRQAVVKHRGEAVHGPATMIVRLASAVSDLALATPSSTNSP